MKHVDYLIVGSGLTGATIARMLHDAGREVLVIDRRQHLGGNVHDQEINGLRIHTYGPHYFRTSSSFIWEWVNRFADFQPFEARVLSDIGAGHLVQWPPTLQQVQALCHGWQPQQRCINPRNLEDAALSMMPRQAYELFIKPYNEKQWGKPPSELSPALCKRFSLRTEGETRLTPGARFQGVPKDGYSAWMAAMLDGIDVYLGIDYQEVRHSIKAKKTIYTGPIDEFFGFDMGRLQYRGQRRAHRIVDASTHGLPCIQVNNPTYAGGAHIRSIDWRHLLNDQQRSEVKRTIITTETPYSPSDPDCFEYPFPDSANQQLAAAYQQRAKEIGPSVLIAGRLGSFQYMDMDQAIAKALSMRGKVMSHSTAQWTGRPSSATQESLSQSVETKQSQPLEQTQQLATHEPEGQSVPEVTTPASQPPSHASSSKSASDRLQEQLLQIVLSEADKHFLGNRISGNSKRAIRLGISEIVGRYVISEAANA
jgi:UDP-galactopyranose mutase